MGDFFRKIVIFFTFFCANPLKKFKKIAIIYCNVLCARGFPSDGDGTGLLKCFPFPSNRHDSGEGHAVGRSVHPPLFHSVIYC